MKVIGYNTARIFPADIEKFNQSRPCSPITPVPRFAEFDSDWNLIDHDFPEEEDGPALLALIEDARDFLKEYRNEDA